MHPLAKSLIGIIIAIIAIYIIFKGVPIIGINPLLSEVIIVLKGIIPLMLLALGLFIAWLYYDEWKIEQEFKKEEERLKKEEAKKTRKKKE